MQKINQLLISKFIYSKTLLFLSQIFVISYFVFIYCLQNNNIKEYIYDDKILIISCIINIHIYNIMQLDIEVKQELEEIFIFKSLLGQGSFGCVY